MGETPEIPSNLSEEGVDFVECCLVHNPQERWTATELLQHHNFCKVSDQYSSSLLSDFNNFSSSGRNRR